MFGRLHPFDGLIIAFLGLAVAACFSGGSPVMNLVYPVVGTLIAIWLFVRDRGAYIFFTMLLWIFTPEIRRFVDYHTEYHTLSQLMLTPLLASALSLAGCLRYAGAWMRRHCFPFVLCGAATFYALFVGVLRNPLAAAAYQFAMWLVPIAWALHAAIWRDQQDLFWRNFDRAMVWGCAISGIYGVAQFFLLPPWDVFWMENADLNSAGLAFPTAFRDFGTMNSPGPFAIYCMAALLLVFAAPSWRRLVAAVPILLGLLLTLVRSSWLGLVVGMLVLAFCSSGRQRMRLAACALAASLLALPLLMTPLVGDFIGTRLSTFGDLKDDNSYVARQDFYNMFIDRAVDNVAGVGFGETGLARKLGNSGVMGLYGNFDNGVLELLFVLGWPGLLVFATGLGMLFAKLGRYSIRRGDALARAAPAIAVAVAVQLLGSNTIVGADGMLFWSAIAAVVTTRVSVAGVSRVGGAAAPAAAQ